MAAWGSLEPFVRNVANLTEPVWPPQRSPFPGVSQGKEFQIHSELPSWHYELSRT